MSEVNTRNRTFAIAAFALMASVFIGPTRFSEELYAADMPTAPLEGKALIVFVRPRATFNDSSRSSRSSIFEIRDYSPDPQFVGLGGRGTKIAYQVDPGKRLFMVVGETADFMVADVLPNRTYYAWVMVLEGTWKARYSLKAVDKQEQNSKEFIDELASSKWVENTAASMNWATSNMPSIRARYTKYHPLWTSKPSSERSSLLPNDGVVGHLQSSEGGASASAVIQMQPAIQTTEEKLRELKRLNDAGLISNEVYLEQQRAILSKP